MEKHTTPKVPQWKIMLFSLGFFGVQLTIMIFAISTPQYMGEFIEKSSFFNYIWLSVPLVGIFIQPILGFVGDHTWNEYGRRGFLILLASSFGSIAIFMLAITHNNIVAIVLFFIALIAINTLIVSYRAVVCEMTPPKERLVGYSMLTILQLLGILTAILIKYVFLDESMSFSGDIVDMPSYVSGLLIFVSFIIFVTALVGVYFLKEYPHFGFKSNSNSSYKYESEAILLEKNKISYLRQGAMWVSIATLIFLVFTVTSLSIEAYIIPFSILIFAVMLMVTHKFNENIDHLSPSESKFVEFMSDLMNMPDTMKKLNFISVFGWFAIFMFLGNLSSIIAENTPFQLFLYSNNIGPDAIISSYIYFISVSIITTPLLLATTTSNHYKKILSYTLLAGVISMILYYYFPTPIMLIATLTMFGVLLSIMYTIPYVLLSLKLPPKRVGVFLGLFNIFMALPYILVPSISSAFVTSYSGKYSSTIIVAIVSLLLSLLFSVRIKNDSSVV